MKYDVTTFEEYILQIPTERKDAILKLRDTILENLPKGFKENFYNSFIQFNVPLDIYPAGYHCTPNEPLPFIAIASQKQFIGFYHMGLYAFEDILKWFIDEYAKHSSLKLDMGKSCVRFKKMDQIPYELIAELCKKITVEMWISKYKSTIKRWLNIIKLAIIVDFYIFISLRFCYFYVIINI